MTNSSEISGADNDDRRYAVVTTSRLKVEITFSETASWEKTCHLSQVIGDAERAAALKLCQLVASAEKRLGVIGYKVVEIDVSLKKEVR